DEATSARALETIERNAEAQAQIIEDLLDVSRIITGRLRLETRELDLTAVIEAAIDTIRPAAEAKAIHIETILDLAAGPVMGDPDRLQQVVWNLVSNAVKFTPKGGQVQVYLERVDSQAQIRVSDTGVGISPEFLPYVFDRFRQADSTSTRTHSGLGLGLAIVRHLVELHGGTVKAESRGERQGATFTVNLPLRAVQWQNADFGLRIEESLVQDDQSAIRTLQSAILEGVRVLVVDDEADARELIATVLERSGAEVTTVGSAAEALEALGQLRPDVLVADIGMPGQDGYGLISEVRALAPERGGNTPAVALTAYARLEDRVRALTAGYQIHVSKPVEPRELVTVVASLIGRVGKSRAG
ncbi:MAG: response regulator, partial [Acidobacteria bacterium]|nr:response regulator [Acidobacteriota bacterium]